MTMIKNNKWKLLISSLLILLPMALGAIIWDELPADMATHFGIQGEADGFSSKGFTVFGMPLILLALHWVCMLGTALDKRNKGQSKKVLGIVFWIVPIVTIITQAGIYLYALNIDVDMFNICISLIGIMFIFVGNYIPKAKQNRTIGVKIPWTLNDEANWNATHRFTGRLWVVCGIVSLLCIFVPFPVKPWALVGVILISVIPPFVYSYIYHKNHK